MGDFHNSAMLTARLQRLQYWPARSISRQIYSQHVFVSGALGSQLALINARAHLD